MIGALFVSLLFAAAEPAIEPKQCMAPVPITEALVQDAAMFDFRGFADEGATPAFLLGGLSPTRDREEAQDVHGTTVFVRDGEGWRAFLPRPGESVIAAYAARESGALIFVTQWQSEGPGQSWTLLRSSDGLATGACSNIDFPDALNQPTWANETLDLTDLNIAASGRGEIIAYADTEDDGPMWYSYRTRDHGATWQSPRRLRSERAARAGVYTALNLEAEAPADLLASLQAYAAGK
jgi:hypothetical protein